MSRHIPTTNLLRGIPPLPPREKIEGIFLTGPAYGKPS